MRFHEFMGEQRAPMRKALKQAAPNLTTFDSLDNNNNPYLAYRFGVALAASPEDMGYEEGPIGSKFTMVDYSDADTEIRKGAEKKMGIAHSTETGKGSEELDSINKTSPLATRKKNQYGV